MNRVSSGSALYTLPNHHTLAHLSHEPSIRMVTNSRKQIRLVCLCCGYHAPAC